MVGLAGPSDEELMIRYASGDNGAFDMLFDRYLSPVFGLAARIAGKNLAEDIRQETFMKVHKNSSQFDSSRGKFSKWIFAITANAAKDRLRKERERNTSSLDNFIGDGGERFSQFLVDPMQKYRPEMAEELARVRKIVEEGYERNDKFYTPLYMHNFLGMKYEDIAFQLKTPLGTVKSRISSAIKNLRFDFKTYKAAA